MYQYLFQKHVSSEYISDDKMYHFEFDNLSCRTIQEARECNEIYVVLDIQKDSVDN